MTTHNLTLTEVSPTVAAEYARSKLSAQSALVFVDFACEAPNWNNTPMIDFEKHDPRMGNLMQLKKLGLVTTSESDDIEWVHFTKVGVLVAAHYGYEVEATAKLNGELI